VWSGPQRSALILGPTRSGKTTSVIIPNVLSSPGAVVSTSTKPDVMHATAAARSRSGSCLLFDPIGQTAPAEGVTRVGWSPLRAASTWDGALEMSASMVAASKQLSSSDMRSSDHWTERSGALLATLLFAGSSVGDDMATVLQWTDRHLGADALGLLSSERGPTHPATSLLTGILATDSREQSGIWSTTSGVLGAYRSLGALDATRAPGIDPETFVAGSHTLYICAPGRQQALLAPLVVGLIGELQAASYRRGDVDAPVVFALDELANIAPLPDLPRVVSEGGGQGLLTIGCLQDLSQARSRWGPEADGFLSLFPATLVLGGIADVRTLKSLSDLAGQRDDVIASHTISRDHAGRRSASRGSSLRRSRIYDVDQIARGQVGRALLLDAAKQIGFVDLTVAHRDEPWRSLSARLGPAREARPRRDPEGRVDLWPSTR